MTSSITFHAPTLALIAALGATMLSGEATAQEQQRQQEKQPEQQQMCRVILSPSTLTAPSEQMPEDVRQQQRIAGKLTLQARLSEDIGNVTEVKVEERSNIQVSLAEAERKQDEARRHQEARRMEKQEEKMQYQEEEMQYQEEKMQHQGEEMQRQEDEQLQEERRQQRRAEPSQNRIPVEVDVSEAQEGEWKVTFTGEGNQECTGTLRVRGSGPNR